MRYFRTGTVLLGGAIGGVICLFGLDKAGATAGPDVVVADLHETRNWGAS